MTWQTLEPRIKQIAERELTPKQLDVWKLHLAGNGRERIALMIGVHPSTIRSHLVATHITLAKHGVRVDQHRRYYLDPDREAA